MKYNIILRNGRYALLEMETQYVVACGFDETQPEGSQWSQGYYYTHWNTSEIVKQRMLSAALDNYRMLTETDYIPRYRLEELATQFKDGLIEDDEEQALIYFDEVCEMSDEEKEFFGIKTENEEKELTYEDYETYYDEENEDTSYYILCSDCGYDESEVE